MVLALAFAGCGENAEQVAAEHLQRARAFHSSGDDRAAVIELKNALHEHPDFAAARALLGRVYVELGLGPSAEKQLRRAKELGARAPDLEHSLVRAILLQGRFKAALIAIDAVSGAGAVPEWLALSGDARLGLGELEPAREAYQAALERDPSEARARRGLAKVSIAGGDVEEAQEELGRILDRAEDDLEAWLLKGELELSLERLDEAHASFTRATEIVPKHAAARIGLARVLLVQRKPADALAELKALGERAGNDPRVRYLHALIARQQNDLDATLEALRDVLKVAPNHAPALLLAGQIHYLRRRFEQAHEHLSRHVAANPQSLVARKLLGAVLIELRQPEGAIEALEPALRVAPDDPQLLALLGTAYLNARQFEKGQALLDRAAQGAPDAAAIRTQLAVSHLASGESSKAISELEAAAELDPDFSRADVLLVLTHFQNRDFDKALAVAQKLTEKRPDAPEAHNLLGAAFEANQEPDSARRSYEKALEVRPEYPTATLNLARMDLLAGNRDQAVAGYERVLEAQAHQPTALLALAKIANDDGRFQEAVSLLERARDKNPAAFEPRVILSGYYLRQRNAEDALRLATEAQAIAPKHPAVRLALGRSQLASRRIDEAIRTLEGLREQAPDAAEPHFQLAVAYLQKQDREASRRALQRVLELAPGHELATLTLGNLALMEEKFDEARGLARQLEAAHPGSPSGHVLQGDVASREGDPAGALEHYQAGMAVRPSNALLLKMYAAHRAAGQIDSGEALLSDWLDGNPNDFGVRLTRATVFHQDGRKEAAQEEYERVLESRPDNAIALNNLAWLYFEQQDERAIELAERAYEAFPERAEIIDTYGWLLLQDGRTEQGLSLLNKALERNPDNPDIRYHHAAGLARAGENDRALEELHGLLGSDEQFLERPAAEKLLNELQ